MKRFFTRILCLSTIPALLLVASEARERYAWFAIFHSDDTSICVGDSHAHTIKLDSGPTIAKGGDPFLISYLTVRRVLELHNLNIHDVFLTIGPQSFSALPESRLSEDSENWLSANGRRISSRLSVVDYIKMGKLSIPTLQHFKYEFSITDKAIPSQPVVRKGLFQPNAEERATRHRVTSSNWFKDQSLQKKHLEGLIKLCEEKNVKLYLVGTPLHRSYRSQIEKSSLKKYKSFLDSIETKHSHVHYVSYESEDWPDSLFHDSDHINSIGGELLGKQLEMTANALKIP